MQTMSFHPVVADIGGHVVDMGNRSLESGAKASITLTGLAPAGAEEVSAQAIQAFEAEAASMLALNAAAQEELVRVGQALAQIAQLYSAVDEHAAETVVLGFVAPPVD